jgi:BlaI family transcriptional regulator, penicillinase repressor
VAARRPPISETEMDVLKVLWEHGAATVRQVNTVLRRRGRRYAYTTVLTLLQRLQAKGHVASDRGGVAHVFSAAVSREGLLRRRLAELADDLCDGTATPLVQALVEGGRLSADDIERLRRLLDQYDV